MLGSRPPRADDEADALLDRLRARWAGRFAIAPPEARGDGRHEVRVTDLTSGRTLRACGRVPGAVAAACAAQAVVQALGGDGAPAPRRDLTDDPA